MLFVFVNLTKMTIFLMFIVMLLRPDDVSGHNTYYDCAREPLDTGMTVMGQTTVLSSGRYVCSYIMR